MNGNSDIIEQLVRPMTELLLKEMEKEIRNLPPDPLQPPAMRLKAFKAKEKQLSKECSAYLSGADDRKLMGRAMELLRDRQVEIEDREEVLREFVSAGRRILEPPADTGESFPGVYDTMQQMFGISDKSMKSLYSAGQRLFDQQSRKQDGVALFTLLTQLNPYMFEPWLGVGVYWLHNTRYRKALFALMMASFANFNHPLPHLYSARCYVATNEQQVATHTLDLALSLVNEDDRVQYAPIISGLQKELQAA